MISSLADIDNLAHIGVRTSIWHHTQIREKVFIGNDCSIGRNVYVGAGVVVGNKCKIQNNALIYEPAELAEGVFIGPGVVITNDKFPRAINSDGSTKKRSDWKPVGVKVEIGASIGAGAICVAPIVIGAWSVVAAGSVVLKDVPPYALVAGVPAKQIGWVGKSGKLIQSDGKWLCQETGEIFRIQEGQLIQELGESE